MQRALLLTKILFSTHIFTKNENNISSTHTANTTRTSKDCYTRHHHHHHQTRTRTHAHATAHWHSITAFVSTLRVHLIETVITRPLPSTISCHLELQPRKVGTGLPQAQASSAPAQSRWQTAVPAQLSRAVRGVPQALVLA